METLTELKEQLTRIEAGLIAQKTVLTFDEVVSFTGLSKSFMYKLTSASRIPHYKPHGKVIYFDRSQVEAWLLQNPIKTIDEIQKEGSSYVTRNKGGLA
jgi:excisionase family DNA binding protein